MSSTELSQDEDLRRLGRLAGIQSLHRNLKAEDSAVAHDIKSHQARDHGSFDVPVEPEEDPMEILATGNVYVNQNEPQKPKPGVSKLAAGLLAAAGLATGGAGAAGLLSLLPETGIPEIPAAVEQRDYELELLPPEPWRPTVQNEENEGMVAVPN